MKILNLIGAFALASFSFAGALAFAGVDSGGGGGAFVCRDKLSGQIQNSELLDLWEGQNIQGWKIPISTESVDEQITFAISKLKYIDENFYEKALAELHHIQSTVNYLPAGVVLYPPSDAQNKYSKQDCPLEGMMYYDGRLDHLQVNKNIFSHLLNSTNVAAAWVHEVIYKILRDVSGQRDSINARALTACLFSTDDCMGLANWPKPTVGAYKCHNPNLEFFYNPQTKEFLYSRIGSVQYGTFLIPQFVPPSYSQMPYVPTKGLLSQYNYTQCYNTNANNPATYNFSKSKPAYKIVVGTPAVICAHTQQITPDQFECEMYGGK